MMKKIWNKVIIAALAVSVMSVQTAWANGPDLMQPGWVNMELGPGAATWVGDTAGAPASENTAVEVHTAPGSGPVDGPAGVAESGTGSPVIVAGGQKEQSVSAAEETVTGQPAAENVLVEEEKKELQAAEEPEQPAVGRQIDPSRPMVALTYDDGPQPSVGNRIMDCLAQYDGKATFFLVGDRIPSRAAEVQRMAAEGHEVANHSMNHKYLQKLGAAEIQAQVVQCNDVIQQVTGVRPSIMRLPGGNHNAIVRANVHMPMIQWSIDTLDWKTRNADATVATVLNQVKDGDIILMHELYSPTADATERIVPELVKRGYQLVTVSEMAAAKGIALQAGQLYSAFR